MGRFFYHRHCEERSDEAISRSNWLFVESYILANLKHEDEAVSSFKGTASPDFIGIVVTLLIAARHSEEYKRRRNLIPF